MSFFNNHPPVPALGPILRSARETAGLTLEEVAKRARLNPNDLELLERDDVRGVHSSRLKAISYARSLGLNPAEITESLPALPVLVPHDSRFLSSEVPRQQPIFLLLLQLFGFLAPMGRAVLYALIITSFFATWGMIRQLSRVRTLPWAVANNSPRSISQP